MANTPRVVIIIAICFGMLAAFACSTVYTGYALYRGVWADCSNWTPNTTQDCKVWGGGKIERGRFLLLRESALAEWSADESSAWYSMRWAFPGAAESVGPKNVRLIPVSTRTTLLEGDESEAPTTAVSVLSPCKEFLERGDLRGLVTYVMRLPSSDLHAEAVGYLQSAHPDLRIEPKEDGSTVEIGQRYLDRVEGVERLSPYLRASTYDSVGRRHWFTLIGGCWGRVTALRAG